MSRDDEFWRRPPAGSPPAPPPTSPPPEVPYAGPPRSAPPPPGWRPPVVTRFPPPRELPAQDHERIDREEAAARTLTRGIGLVVAAVLLVMLLALCARGLL